MQRSTTFNNVLSKKHSIKRHGSVSRRVYYTIYVYRWETGPCIFTRVASTRDYRISITAESMKFWIGAIDSFELYYKSIFIFSLRALWAEILRCKVWIWKFFFKKRRYQYYCRHRRPIYIISCYRVATSDAKGAND